jgi:hypothetical protein
MRFAAWCSPAITQDEDYIMETGLLEDTLGLQKPEADYYRARLAEDAGFRFQSRTMDLEGLHATRNQPAVQRAYVSILLIHAANAFDSGDINDAAALIEQVLATDPVNLRAICSLQLAYLRSGNMDGVNALDQRLTKVYDFFNNLLKEPILATSTENQAVGELDRGDAAAALKAWTESKTR